MSQLKPDEMEHAPGTAHESLEGFMPPMATEAEVIAALDRAFDYRGDVTLALRDGTTIEGYLFDRRSAGKTLADCTARIFPRDRDEKITVHYSDIVRLAFTGRDTAAGRSFETWMRKYQERKAAGEKNIGLEPEKLD